MYRSGFGFFGMKNKLSRVLRSSCYGMKPKPSTAVGCARSPSSATETSFLTHLSERVAHPDGGISMLLRQHAMLRLSPFQLSSITSQHIWMLAKLWDFFEPFATFLLCGLLICALAAAAVLTFIGVAEVCARMLSSSQDIVFIKTIERVFIETLERVRNDAQVRKRMGSPISSLGSGFRSRSWIDDEDGNEHVQVNFDICGPLGAGSVESVMFRDKVDEEWKFKYLTVEVTSPSPAKLMVEPAFQPQADHELLIDHFIHF